MCCAIDHRSCDLIKALSQSSEYGVVSDEDHTQAAEED
jgi:hypothetical protein